MKPKLNIFLLCFVLLIYSNTVYSSDSYFYSKYKDMGGYLSYDVYCINLGSGVKNVILRAENNIGYPFILSDHSKIIFQCQNKICVYDHTSRLTDTLLYLGEIEQISNVSFHPSTKEIFLSIVKMGSKVINKELHYQKHTFLAIDKNNYTFIDTINSFATIKSVIARNREKIFQLVDTTEGIMFRSRYLKPGHFDFSTIFIKGYENIRMKYKPYFIDTVNGYAFISYISEIDGNGHLVLCEPENESSVSHMNLPVGVPPYEKCLTPNGDMIFQDNGDVYIYDGQTTELKQKLEFKPSQDPNVKSKLVILNDKLYFFPEDPAESTANVFDNIQYVNLTINQPDSAFIEVLIDYIEEAKENGTIDNKGIANSLISKLETAQKQLEKEKPKQAVNALNAFLNELEAQNEKHIAEEVYTYLKEKVEGLIAQLEE